MGSTEIVVLIRILTLVFTVGNALILLAIYRQKTVSNAFIASLGVADFSVGVIINPLWVSKSVLNIWQSDIL